jgi:23S rRNA (uracil1939-C5)-methyltransferase
MPAPGDLIALDIEKPAAGGRMLARLDGQIVFVSGTIPGEHVTARVEFVRGGVVFARAESIDVWSPDRRAAGADRICGGNDYAHIAYERQLALKRDLVEDAFSRIAKLALPPDVPLHPSPERGYRMRARLHVEGGQVGFYRQASIARRRRHAAGRHQPRNARRQDQHGARARSQRRHARHRPRGADRARS